MSGRGASSGVRSLPALSVAACVGVGLATAFVACRSDDVLIGIETDGGVGLSLIVLPPSDAAADGPTSFGVSTFGDAAFTDADLGPCLPDAGCPAGSVCEYLVVEAGCALPGVCLASGGPPLPPAPTPTLLKLAPRLLAPRVFDPYNGYTTKRPSCIAADAGASEDAADGARD